MPPFFTIGTLSGALSVALGAFGAHGLKSHVADPVKLAGWKTGAEYHLIHSTLLTLASVAAPHNTLAMSLLTAGITMFSGSLYGLTLLGNGSRWRRVLGPVTPLGGVCLIGGWVALAYGGLGEEKRGRGRGGKEE